MRISKILTVAAFATLASVAAHADHYSDFYVIPVAGHTPGVNGTNWMSDLAIQNFQSSPLTVEIAVVESGFNSDNVFSLTRPDGSSSVTIPAGGSALLKDILGGQRGNTSTLGALLVGADRAFAVTSRAYSMSPSGDTVGQTVPPAANFLDNTLAPIDLATAVAYVPGLVQNNDFRTNLGFVAANGSASGASMNMSVTIKGEDGTTLGTKTYSIASGAVVQLQFSARQIASGNFNVGGAEFRITSGTGSVVPYASVIDNRTADAVFVMGVFPKNATTTAAGKALTPSLFRSILDRSLLFNQ